MFEKKMIFVKFENPENPIFSEKSIVYKKKCEDP